MLNSKVIRSILTPPYPTQVFLVAGDTSLEAPFHCLKLAFSHFCSFGVGVVPGGGLEFGKENKICT